MDMFFYTAYADDTAFLSCDKEYVKELLNVFNTFSGYTILKTNNSWH